MSHKNSTLSPYTYCANNPIMMVDPDGRRITLIINYVKDQNGNDTKKVASYNIRITGKIINLSGTKVDMQKVTNEINTMIEKIYCGIIGIVNIGSSKYGNFPNQGNARNYIRKLEF